MQGSIQGQVVLVGWIRYKKRYELTVVLENVVDQSGIGPASGHVVVPCSKALQELGYLKPGAMLSLTGKLIFHAGRLERVVQVSACQVQPSYAMDPIPKKALKGFCYGRYYDEALKIKWQNLQDNQHHEGAYRLKIAGQVLGLLGFDEQGLAADQGAMDDYLKFVRKV